MRAPVTEAFSLAAIFFGPFADLFRRRRAARVPGRRMVFEPLESRLLPSADFVGVEVPAPDALTAVASVFFVSTTGADANDGLTPGTAFRTIQRAITEAGVAD